MQWRRKQLRNLFHSLFRGPSSRSSSKFLRYHLIFRRGRGSLVSTTYTRRWRLLRVPPRWRNRGRIPRIKSIVGVSRTKCGFVSGFTCVIYVIVLISRLDPNHPGGPIIKGTRSPGSHLHPWYLLQSPCPSCFPRTKLMDRTESLVDGEEVGEYCSCQTSRLDARAWTDHRWCIRVSTDAYL